MCRCLDVAIVGAGPGGAWAAYLLARAGARVAIFDPTHPREKPCGGGVTERALELVADALGSSDAGGNAPASRTSLPAAVAISTARFDGSAARQRRDGPWDPFVTATVTLGPSRMIHAPRLLVSSRREFDARLLEAATHAGAVHVNARVLDVVVDVDRVTVRTATGDRCARSVIGADGANSLVRRRVSTPFSREQLSIATGFFAHGLSSDQIVIRFTSNPAGYIWSFPRPDHLAIGICAQADAVTAGALRRRVASWIEHWGGANGARLEPYSWPIPGLAPNDFERLAPGGDRWMLVGDAAGLVDPLTREGIYFAIRSGALAAAALRQDVPSPGIEYSESVRQELCPELATASALRRSFFHPAFTRVMIEILQESASIRSLMADLVVGRLPYRRLRRRVLARLEPGAAWRVMKREATRMFEY